MPKAGEFLPRVDAAYGIREKLAGYSLQRAHESGGPKARGFEQILGITLADVDYLVAALHAGVRRTPITSVRDNSPFGAICEVRIPVRGVRAHTSRTTTVTTAWELRHAEAAPRLVTAYIKG